ncbi:MAG: helix-turn-helix domain-containing protein [Brevundimonas sp.]|uniref:helix-turn-helix domain-containing protein n=1 Tax=Brevundimonas sp. TaxID=1871086 RepID=UPI0040347FD6
MDPLRERFGRLVAARRREKGWTQQQLAEHSGLSHETINRIERGVVAARFPNIGKIAEALEVDPSELFAPDMPRGVGSRGRLLNLTARLSMLSDKELEWLEPMIDAALKPRPEATQFRLGRSMAGKSPPTDRK